MGAAALLTAAGMLLLLIALSSSIRHSRVFPEEVQQYRFLVEHYARKEGIRNYTDDLLAIMTVESGGRLEDLMQSSESLGLAPDSLDSESSIAQGCSYYASLIKSGKKHHVDNPAGRRKPTAIRWQWKRTGAGGMLTEICSTRN